MPAIVLRTLAALILGSTAVCLLGGWLALWIHSRAGKHTRLAKAYHRFERYLDSF